ncbi:MAG: hypothetical protein FWD22_05380 [Treponema sp.]|nr:hypothetical protein [Treponema sp.]
MKGRIVFLPVPDSFKNQYNKSGEAFPINPRIPIPVEIPQDGDESNISNLSMDMIISGMLRVIEEKQAKKEWLDYYSGFVLFLRPDILEICQTHEEKQSLIGESKS